MTFTKALIAKKIADDCGFMKGEAVEIFEKMLEIMKARLVARGRPYDVRIREMVC